MKSKLKISGLIKNDSIIVIILKNRLSMIRQTMKVIEKFKDEFNVLLHKKTMINKKEEQKVLRKMLSQKISSMKITKKH